MPIETWTPKPDAGATGDSEFRTLSVQFGDGYTQSAGDGLNGEHQRWPLTFTRRRADVEPLLAFIRRHQGYKSFIWTPPLGEPGLYKVTAFSNSPLGAGWYRISATFEQAYHP